MADNKNKDVEKQQNEIHRIANKGDVWHLVQRGQLVQQHFDLEASGLNKQFDQVYSYGDAIGDIAGNLIDWTEFHIQRPERNFPTVESLLVTRTDIDEIDKEEGRVPHRVGMARIADRFENAGMMIQNLKGLREVEGHEFRTARKVGEQIYYKEYTETILEYPMRGDDGEIHYDVRIHPERNMYAYRVDENPESDYYENVENNYYVDEDGSKWKLTEPSTIVSGYRIKWYDIQLLRYNMLRAGLHPSNSFFAFSQATLTNKQHRKNTAVDTYSVIAQTFLQDAGGEGGLQIGKTINRETGETASSRKLELILGNNTRYKNTIRNVPEGMFMPHNRAIYDHLRAHKSPAYDALASFAAYNYSRDLNPNVVKEVELQSDEQYLRQYLPGLDLTDTHAPVYSMPVNAFPDDPKSVPMIFAGFDDHYGKMNQAIMIRADIDLRHDRFDGKTLKEMAIEHHNLPDSKLHESPFVQFMRKQGYGPDAVIRRESIRRWGGTIPIQDALNTRAMEHWDPSRVLDDNFTYLLADENDDIVDAIRESVGVLNWEWRQHEEPANPMMEEQWGMNGFGDLDFVEYEARSERYQREKEKSLPSMGREKTIVETLFEKSTEIFNYHTRIDTRLHELVLQPHPIDFVDPDDIAERQRAEDNFFKLFKKVHKYFKDKNVPYIDMFKGYYQKGKDGKPTTKVRKLSMEEAQDFRWKMMKRFLADDQAEKMAGEKIRGQSFKDGVFDYENTQHGRVLFANLSRNFRVVDDKNRELSIEYIKQQFAEHPGLVFDKLESEEWKIQFYRLSSEPSITATLMQFADMGKLDDLDTIWQFRYEALERLYLNGAPSDKMLDVDDARWAGIMQLERSLARLEINAPADRKKELVRIFKNSNAAGQAEMFLNSDEGVRFLANYKRKLEAVKAEKPLTDEFAKAVNWDADAGMAYDNHEIEVPAEDYVEVVVPDTHIRRPLQDIRKGPNALVIHRLKKQDREKVQKGTPVVLRGEQTGRRYAVGPVKLETAPSETGSYARFMERAQRAYTDMAGVKFPRSDRRDVMIVQDVVPIADPGKGIDYTQQTVKVPNEYFDGLVSPRLAHFEDHEAFTALVLPTDYCPQEFEADQPILFREMNAPMGSKVTGAESADTGHSYNSTLRSVQQMKVGDLRHVDNELARRCGYASSLDMWEKVRGAFLNREAPNPDNEDITLLTFDQVDKDTWAYAPTDAARAVFTYDGEPASPSKFRWLEQNKRKPSI